MGARLKFPAQHAVAAAIAVCFVPVIWMAFDRDPPYIITNGRIDPPVVAANGEYVVIWDVKTLRQCEVNAGSSVATYIIDTNGERHSYDTTAGGYVGQSDIVKVKRMLDVPPGPAKYYSRVCYSCNPVQELLPVCFDTPVINFVVAKE